MSGNRADRRALLFATVFVVTGTLCLRSVGRAAQALHHRKTVTAALRNQDAMVGGASEAAASERDLSRGATAAGVRTLLSLVPGRAGAGPTIDWDATPAASLRFLSQLEGRAAALSVNAVPSDAGPDLVRMRVETAVPPVLAPPPPRTAEVARLATDVFVRVSPAPARPDPSASYLREMKAAEAARESEAAQAEKDRAAAAEKDRLEAKRRQIAADWVLSGVAHAGSEALAFVSRHADKGRTATLRVGDTMDDVRVTAIDESRGEITVNYADRFTLTLSMANAGTPGTP